MTPDLRLAAELLGIEPGERDEKIIRRAYLRAIKNAPPEREPERFQALREAFEALQHAARVRAATRAFPSASAARFGGEMPEPANDSDARGEGEHAARASDEPEGRHAPHASHEVGTSRGLEVEPQEDFEEKDEREQNAVDAFELADSVEDALAIAEAAVAAHPDRPWPYVLLVRARLERREVELALEVARDAAERGFHEPLVEAAWLAREALSEPERATVEAQLELWDAATLFSTFDAPRAERATRAILALARAHGGPLRLAAFARVTIGLEAFGAHTTALALHREVLALRDVIGESRALSPREGLFVRWVHELLSLPDDFDSSLRAALVRVVAEADREGVLAGWAKSRSIAERSTAQRKLAEHAPRVAEAFGGLLFIAPNPSWDDHPPPRRDDGPRGWSSKKTSWDSRRDPLELDTWETPPRQTHADRHWQVWILVMACMAALPRLFVSLASSGTTYPATVPVTQTVGGFGYGGRGLGPATTTPPEPVAPDTDALNELLCRDPSRAECEDALRVGNALRDEDCDAATEAWDRLETAFLDTSDDLLRDVDVRLVALRRADVRALCQQTRQRLHDTTSPTTAEPTDSPSDPPDAREPSTPSREVSPP
ncbi:MAG: J domain-containing protein [Myxococcales bacterium]|nr:J domain-containing protein [Myxococcales bacterium]